MVGMVPREEDLFRLLPPSFLSEQELWQGTLPMYLHKPLHQTPLLLLGSSSSSLLPSSSSLQHYYSQPPPMDLATASLLLVLTLTPQQKKKQTQQSRIPSVLAVKTLPRERFTCVKKKKKENKIKKKNKKLRDCCEACFDHEAFAARSCVCACVCVRTLRGRGHRAHL